MFIRMATKSDYLKWIWQYKRRRQSYKKHVRELSKQIDLWKGHVRRIERTNSKLKSIKTAVDEYFETDISSKKMDKKNKLARSIYYKIAIESGIEGKRVSEYIGRNKKAAGHGRLSFTRSFGSSPENKIAFHNFKNFFENKIV